MRYQLIGHVTVEHDVNEQVMTREQQQGTNEVVYETDDRDEAQKLVREGGFIRQRDSKWIAVTGARDTQGIPTHSPLEK
jgi:hypothetical protein